MIKSAATRHTRRSTRCTSYGDGWVRWFRGNSSKEVSHKKFLMTARKPPIEALLPANLVSLSPLFQRSVFPAHHKGSASYLFFGWHRDSAIGSYKERLYSYRSFCGIAESYDMIKSAATRHTRRSTRCASYGDGWVKWFRGNSSKEEVNIVNSPSSSPLYQPSYAPSGIPTGLPPYTPSSQPTSLPFESPRAWPSHFAFRSTVPTSVPSFEPSGSPPSWPSSVHSLDPSAWPYSAPASVPFCLRNLW